MPTEFLNVVGEMINPEDLVRIPGTDWILTSGLSGPNLPAGSLGVIHLKDHRRHILFPDGGSFRLDAAQFGDVDRPNLQNFTAHGIGLRTGRDGIHTLYMVNHGGRESVEVFEVDATGTVPALTWIGAVVADSKYRLNDVVPHPDGGFLVTNLCTGGQANWPKVFAGEPSGCVLRWTDKDTGFSEVPGSHLNSPNGLEVSRDGKRCFINSWGTGELVRISLETGEVEARATVDFLPDNLTWAADGRRLLSTGQIATREFIMHGFFDKDRIDCPFKVSAIDSDTMAVEELVSFDDPEVYGMGTTAIDVDGLLWVGSARNVGLAVFRLGS